MNYNSTGPTISQALTPIFEAGGIALTKTQCKLLKARPNLLIWGDTANFIVQYDEDSVPALMEDTPGPMPENTMEPVRYDLKYLRVSNGVVFKDAQRWQTELCINQQTTYTTVTARNAGEVFCLSLLQEFKDTNFNVVDPAGRQTIHCDPYKAELGDQNYGLVAKNIWRGLRYFDDRYGYDIGGNLQNFTIYCPSSLVDASRNNHCGQDYRTTGEPGAYKSENAFESYVGCTIVGLNNGYWEDKNLRTKDADGNYVVYAYLVPQYLVKLLADSEGANAVIGKPVFEWTHTSGTSQRDRFFTVAARGGAKVTGPKKIIRIECRLGK